MNIIELQLLDLSYVSESLPVEVACLELKYDAMTTCNGAFMTINRV